MVYYRDEHSFVMADIPGIIEGASEGKGLGYRFLRHIERNAVLLFLIPADASDIQAQYNILLHELEAFNPELLLKKRMLAISKSDLLDEELKTAITAELPKDLPHVFISAMTEQGIDALKDQLWKMMNEL
jgi:GTP-binding protein